MVAAGVGAAPLGGVAVIAPAAGVRIVVNAVGGYVYFARGGFILLLGRRGGGDGAGGGGRVGGGLGGGGDDGGKDGEGRQPEGHARQREQGEGAADSGGVRLSDGQSLPASWLGVRAAFLVAAFAPPG